MAWFQSKKTAMPQKEDALPGRAQPIPTAQSHHVKHVPLKGPYPEGSAKALFGLGSFWGAERVFWNLPGVYVTAVGYAGGYTPNPTYEEVCTGRTGHNEVVLVVYDPKVVSYDALLKTFWSRTTRRKACVRAMTSEHNTAPASILIARAAEQAEASKTAYQQALKQRGYGEITTEIVPAPEFYFAEDYHQQYLSKNPRGYCGLGGTGVTCPIGVGVDA